MQPAIRVYNEPAIRSYSEPKAKIKKSRFQGVLRHWDLYLMMLLPLTWFIIFAYVPMVGLQIAFRNFLPIHGFFGSDFVGFMHFERFFNSFHFRRVITNTLSINIYTLIVGFPIPIIFALMLNELRSKRYKSLVQNLTYIPNFLSAVVVVSILQLMLCPDNGVINNFMRSFLNMNPINFMAVPGYFQHIFVWSGVWETMGWNAIIFLAALAGVDPGFYEAATIDGASRLQKIIYISLPCISGTIVIMLLLRLGTIMHIGFEKILLMQNPLNMSRSDVVSTFVYRSGILGADFSFATAVGFFNSVLNFSLLVVANAIARRFCRTSLW